MWVDSHAHLTMFEPSELEEVVARAVNAGVDTILVPATSPTDLVRVHEIVEEHGATVVGAAGVHPHDADLLDASAKRAIEASLERPGIVAVGEIGLDYYYERSPREDQRQALAWQLDLARAAQLPVVLHNRDSWGDLVTMLRQDAGELRGVCHSFAEGPDEACEAVALGLCVGFSGMLTFKWADRIRQAAGAVPLNRVMVETDSPYLAPVPHRGRRNEPAYVAATGQRLATLREHSIEAVASQTTTVFRELFALNG
ncbi:MAG: YchF/TatD family DNA exonuclease [Armatimonadia bacterium]|nr:YchF/TatD family DNA exonuclease [Armatimonadia bacterium]